MDDPLRMLFCGLVYVEFVHTVQDSLGNLAFGKDGEVWKSFNAGWTISCSW